MALKPILGEVQTQPLNDNFSYLKSEIQKLAGLSSNILSDPYFGKFPIKSSDIETYFRKDANGDLEAYASTTSVKTLETASVNTAEFLQLSFTITVDTTKNYGCLGGFKNTTTNARFLVGYEPAYKGIVFYYEGKPFQTIIPESKLNLSEYMIVIKKFIDGTVLVYINSEEFNPKLYFSEFTFDFNIIRFQLKTNELGLKLKNLALTYVQNYYPEVDIDGVKTFSTQGKQLGRNVHIYKFNGTGNDWCFVRTPDNYDPKGKPHPFVICNHGNGWTMDGTPQKASWTKRTMYVQANDPDYVANPTQYNLVPPEHPEWLYSNPTIEALLSAGYVVCGAQNFGDNLYGNDNCRNACVDFFYHMITSFNVESRCSMIGASNGAMTSLNAMYLLGGTARVKSMILQYPLTCLWRQYTNYPAHQTDIQNAYGIPAGLTEDQFEKATRTHDPEKVNTMLLADGKRAKTTALPPIKFYYSFSDPTTSPNNNSLALMKVLEDSNLINEGVEATGGHGDRTHFDPAAYVNWFEKYR